MLRESTKYFGFGAVMFLSGVRLKVYHLSIEVLSNSGTSEINGIQQVLFRGEVGRSPETSRQKMGHSKNCNAGDSRGMECLMLTLTQSVLDCSRGDQISIRLGVGRLCNPLGARRNHLSGTTLLPNRTSQQKQ